MLVTVPFMTGSVSVDPATVKGPVRSTRASELVMLSGYVHSMLPVAQLPVPSSVQAENGSWKELAHAPSPWVSVSVTSMNTRGQVPPDPLDDPLLDPPDDPPPEPLLEPPDDPPSGSVDEPPPGPELRLEQPAPPRSARLSPTPTAVVEATRKTVRIMPG